MYSTVSILLVAGGSTLLVALLLRGLGHRRARTEAMKLFNTLNRR